MALALRVMIYETRIQIFPNKNYKRVTIKYNCFTCYGKIPYPKGQKMTKENEYELVTFHNEGAISRISLWANIIGYTILVFSLIAFVYQVYQLSNSWAQIAAGLPANLFERIAIFVSNVFLEPLRGVFYFLVLRGISQLLNLGLDLYYANVEDEVVVEEVVPTPEA
jgi:hypothetical protein